MIFVYHMISKVYHLPTLCQWVKESWDAIDKEIIINAFKKCSISNSMDGTEDEKLWEEEQEVCTEKVPEESEEVHEEDPYDDQLSSKDWSLLFEEPQCEQNLIVLYYIADITLSNRFRNHTLRLVLDLLGPFTGINLRVKKYIRRISRV